MIGKLQFFNFSILQLYNMLTLKLITEETERVIKGLEKKHFPEAKAAVEKAIAIDKQRREAQTKLDAILAESKKYAAQIGQLMKAGKKQSGMLPEPWSARPGKTHLSLKRIITV